LTQKPRKSLKSDSTRKPNGGGGGGGGGGGVPGDRWQAAYTKGAGKGFFSGAGALVRRTLSLSLSPSAEAGRGGRGAREEEEGDGQVGRRGW